MSGAPGADDEAVTTDTLLRGRVKILQPARGLRASLDPVLLAGFVAPPFGRFLDIGCGTGALSFLLLARDPDAAGVGVEIQPRLARLAQRGAEANGFGARLEVREGDLRAMSAALAAAGPFDLVATNPPFRPLGTAVLPPDEERALAHHEVALTLADWLDAAAAALAPAGRLDAIYPAERLGELLAGLRARGLAPVRLRFVKARVAELPGRVLVEARPRAAAGGVAVAPPLVVHEANGFTPEVRAMLGDD